MKPGNQMSIAAVFHDGYWRLLGLLLAALLSGLWPPSVLAQELSPRLYWPAPVGTQVVVLGYQHSSGDVLLDPSLPIYGVDSDIGTMLAGYVRTFDWWGRTTNVLFELPYSRGSTQGLFEGETLERSFAGFNDVSLSMTVNLVGAPAMDAGEFQALRADPRPIVGLNMKLVVPTGHYEKDRLINVGANRWAARVQIGTILPLRPRWLFEFAAGAWLFTDDDDFIAGERKQRSIFAAEAHLIHRFRPGFWLALDANYFRGGQQTVGGVERLDLQKNSRLGATLAVPIPGRSALKFSYSTGTRTRYGSDFSQLTLTYQKLLR